MILIISGVGRSGTTLLRELCNSHPAINVSLESAIFSHVNSSYPGVAKAAIERTWKANRGRWAFSGPQSSRDENHRRNITFTLRQLAAVLVAMRGRILPAASPVLSGRLTMETIERALKMHAQDSSVVGDKWPHYLFQLDRLTSYPQARIAVIYRDGRDVTGSFLARIRTDWRHDPLSDEFDSAEKVARYWVDGIEMMERFRDRIHIIRYEDLVTRTNVELQRLAEWLGVDAARFAPEGVHSDSIGAHRRPGGLTADEIESVRRVAGATLSRLGYT